MTFRAAKKRMDSHIRSRQAALLGTACAVTLLALGVRAQQAASVLQVPDNPALPPAPEQPVEYSHRTHLALGLVCEACHANTAANSPIGYPETATCMACHSSIGRDLPQVERLAELDDSGEPIGWVRVYQVLAGVTWDHEPHLSAGVDCGACHGDMAQVDATTMTTSVTSMASCIGCHQAHEADTACSVCHAWPLDEFLDL